MYLVTQQALDTVAVLTSASPTASCQGTNRGLWCKRGIF